MSSFQAGFARLDITPPLGVEMAGYFFSRRAEGILDPLYVSALAVSDGERIAVILSIDILGIQCKEMDQCRAIIAERSGLPVEAVFISCTHTHTGPVISSKHTSNDPVWNDIMFRRMADAAVLAIADLASAEASVARGSAKDISYIRRFRMKDGKIRTNPGIGNPDICHPIGEPDEEVQLVRLKREGAEELLLVNFQVHPDVIGGCRLSADYPKFIRDTLERALPGTRCVYFNGAQGDTNHFDVNAAEGKENGGYEHAKHMGRSIAGAVLAVYGKCEGIKTDVIRFLQRDVRVLSNRPDESQLPEAKRLIVIHEAAQPGLPPGVIPEDMEYTTRIAEAYRINRLKDAPDTIALPLVGIRFGEFAICGIPGEPFTEVGRAIKQNSPFAMTFVCCCANGYEGYYPTREAFGEGGYEARTSNFHAGIAETLAKSSIELLTSLRDNRREM